MAFVFRLQSLLNYRRSQEEQAQLQLGRELRQLVAHQDRLRELQQQRQQIIVDFEERKKRKMGAALCTFYFESIAHAEQLIGRQRQMIAAQEQVVAGCRARLLDRLRDRQVLEQLRDKDQQAFQRQELARELKENDEQAMLLFNRDSLLTV